MQDCKTDLTDVTFLVPLRVDSTERKENIDTLVKYMFRYFDTTFVVLEADSNRKFYPDYENKNFHYEFMGDIHEFFYKTKSISRLISMAETQLVAVWDADVIVPPYQILTSLEKLRSNNAFMSLPYNGRAYLTDKFSAELFKGLGDIAILMKLIPVMPLMYGYHSAGGENEKFHGWGPEDAERVKRLEIMNLPIHYSEGPLFHLWHPRGKTSWYTNNRIEIQNRREFIETCKKSGFK